MKFFIYSAFSLILVFSANLLKAQGTYTGCLLSSTKVLYRSEYLATGYFSSKSGVTPLSNSYCFWNQTVSNPISCTVCTGPNSVTYNTTTGAFISCDTPVVGIRGTFSMVYCPLDNNLTVLLLLSAIAGFLFIRQTKFIELFQTAV